MPQTAHKQCWSKDMRAKAFVLTPLERRATNGEWQNPTTVTRLAQVIVSEVTRISNSDTGHTCVGTPD